MELALTRCNAIAAAILDAPARTPQAVRAKATARAFRAGCGGKSSRLLTFSLVTIWDQRSHNFHRGQLNLQTSAFLLN